LLTKFTDEKITAKGEDRAWVTLKTLKTLWFNTGTQCNLKCINCYIESSPTNDRLVYLKHSDVVPFLDELDSETQLLAFTGGEPFINSEIIPILKSCLETKREVLVLTNAFNVLKRHKDNLELLLNQFGSHLHLRISLDHYTKDIHEGQRGVNTFDKTLDQMKWLYDKGFNISIAGRSLLNESVEDALSGYQSLLNKNDIKIDLKLNDKIVIFPEMNESEDVPEITTACWDILNVSADDQMCASERMIVKRKGQEKAVVLPCTLLAYDEQFELGNTLKDSKKDVYLNHSYCSKFCVLGGASCSSAK
jgi:MoaA/NifB/PqqE/SkfB family radical SAM enzyme